MDVVQILGVYSSKSEDFQLYNMDFAASAYRAVAAILDVRGMKTSIPLPLFAAPASTQNVDRSNRFAAWIAPLRQHLAGLWPAEDSVAEEAETEMTTLRLARGAVRRIDEKDNVQEVQVFSGAVWLTSTPAEGDVILKASGRYFPSEAFPYVIEALSDTSVVLLQKRPVKKKRWN